MNDDAQVGIFPVHEVFYLESMLLVTSSALDAGDRIADALDEGSKHQPESRAWQECTYVIIHGVHTIAVQAGVLSRYFWPARQKAMHVERAAQLRRGLSVSQFSPLQSRDLRNKLEHFDERLDDFLAEGGGGSFKLAYVGSFAESETQNASNFRAYYTDVGVLEVLGLRLEMQPVLDEVRRIHNLIVQCLEHGGRLPT